MNRILIILCLFGFVPASCSCGSGDAGPVREREHLLQSGCYELKSSSDCNQRLLQGLVSRLLLMEPFSPDTPCDRPFYELCDIRCLPQIDSCAMFGGSGPQNTDSQMKELSYRLIQQIKLRDEGIWYANDDMMNLATDRGISTWTDPLTGRTILDPCFMASRPLQWKTCREERLEKLTLSLLDGSPLESYTPLRWRISFDYCIIPCIVDYPSFRLNVERIAAVSSLVIVRNLNMHINSYDIYNLSPSGTGTINLSLSVPETDICCNDGMYLLGRIYTFIPVE